MEASNLNPSSLSSLLSWVFAMRVADHLAMAQARWSSEHGDARDHPWLRRLPGILACGRRFHRPRVYMWLLRREPLSVVPFLGIPVLIVLKKQEAVPLLVAGIAIWRAGYDLSFVARHVSLRLRLWHAFGKLALGLAAACFCAAMLMSMALGLIFACGLAGLSAAPKARLQWPARRSH